MCGVGVRPVRSSGSAVSADDGGVATSAAGVTSCVRGRKEGGGEGASVRRRRERKEEVEGDAGCGVEDQAEVATTRRRTRLRYCLIGNLGLYFCWTGLRLVLEIIRCVAVYLERVLCVHVECLRKCP